MSTLLTSRETEYPAGGLLVTLSILVIELLYSLAVKHLPGLLRSTKGDALAKEIKAMKKEARILNTPDTFSQSAKIQRMVLAKEKELKQLQEKKGPQQIISLLVPVLLRLLKFGFYSAVVLWYWSTPVVTLPLRVLQPFGVFLAWPFGAQWRGGGAVSIVAWLAISSRVGEALCRALV